MGMPFNSNNNSLDQMSSHFFGERVPSGLRPYLRKRTIVQQGVIERVSNNDRYDIGYGDGQLLQYLGDSKRSLAGPSGSKAEVEKLREEYMRIMDQMELPPKEEEEKEG